MAEICPVCGLPKELCMCEEIAREQQTVRISTELLAYGNYTVVEGMMRTTLTWTTGKS